MRTLLIVAALASVAHAQATADCFTAAEDRTLLLDLEASRLCQGAQSLAPLQCFQLARGRTLLTDNQAVDLCRCAQSNEPVACYSRARGRTLADDFTIIQMCAPSSVYSLGADCRRGYILPYGAPLP